MIEYIPGERMFYIVGENRYTFSYQDLAEKYAMFRALPDKEFRERLPEILHYTIFVCWLKERTAQACADDGVIHELAHLMHLPDATSIAEVRAAFDVECRL